MPAFPSNHTIEKDIQPLLLYIFNKLKKVFKKVLQSGVDVL